MKQNEIIKQLKEDGYTVQFPSIDTYHQAAFVMIEGQCLNIDTDADYEDVLAAIESIKTEKYNARLSSWGGAREGAGRPSTGRKQCKFYLTEEEKESVKEYIAQLRS